MMPGDAHHNKLEMAAEVAAFADDMDLRKFLSEDYCCACDSFGHTEMKEYGLLWCNVCWDQATRIPSRLRRAIEHALEEDPYADSDPTLGEDNGPVGMGPV